MDIKTERERERERERVVKQIESQKDSMDKFDISIKQNTTKSKENKF